MVYDQPWLIPEWKTVLLGQQMYAGFTLYSEIWDDTAPLSALVYWGMYALFGEIQLAYQLVASGLVLVQALMFNEILRGRQVFLDLTLVPALLYVVLMHIFPDMFVLSPPLLANTFLLVVVRYLFLHIAERRRYSAVFEIGAYIGLAALFYLPAGMFLLVPLLAFLSFTSTKSLEYLLMFFAFLFPLGVAFLVFFLSNHEYDFYLNFLVSVATLHTHFYLPWYFLLFILGYPLGLCLLTIAQFGTYRLYTNYQNRCQNLMGLWLLAGAGSLLLASEVSVFSLIPMLLAVVFMLSHFFLMMRAAIWREGLFLLLLLGAIYTGYGTMFGHYLTIPALWRGGQAVKIKIPTDDLIARPHPQAHLFAGKKIWVADQKPMFYLGARVSTPYLHWGLAQRHFGKMSQYYDIQVQVYQNLFSSRNAPDFIIDPRGEARKIFQTLPLAKSQYEYLQAFKIYRRKTALRP
ncbi:MAG: hypothetical protein OHK0053_16990 [Microscillaceae bacterium]